MSDNEHIYRQGVWAEREASQPILNAQRLAWFESVKSVLVDRGNLRSKLYPPPLSNVVDLNTYQGLQNAVGQWANYPGAGLGCLTGFWGP